MKRRIALLLASLLCLASFPARAEEAPVLAWHDLRPAALQTPNENYRNLATKVDARGDIVVMGLITTSGGPFTYLAKYESRSGTQLWFKRDSSPSPFSMALDAHGDVLVAAGDTTAPCITKFSGATGSVLWKNFLNAPSGTASCNAVAVDADNNVWVTGHMTPAGQEVVYLHKYAPDGTQLRASTLSSAPTGRGTSLALDASGNVFVSAMVVISYNSYSYRILKYTPTASIAWNRTFTGSTEGLNQPTGIRVDSQDNAIVYGRSSTGGSTSQLQIIKYASANGIELWQRSYKDPNDGVAEAMDAAIDSQDNIVVTGHNSGGVNGPATFLLKYAADGTELWRYRNPATAAHRLDRSIALDKHDNPVVCGVFNNKASVAKHSSADGSLLWEYSYNENQYTTAHSHAIDPMGNIVGGGTSLINSEGFLTFKLSTNLTTESRLSWLALNQGSLSPSFHPDTQLYTARVPFTTESITVAPTAGAANATAMVNDVVIASGGTSGAIPLNVGSNLITVTGTAQDGITTTSYTVEVIRETIFESWMTQHGLLTATSNNDADALDNLQEFAFGTNPKAINGASLVLNGGTLVARGTPVSLDPASPAPQAVFTRRKDWLAAGLSYTVQFSDNLTDWQTSSATPAVLADDGEVEAVAVPYPAFPNNTHSRFFRVIVNR